MFWGVAPRMVLSRVSCVDASLGVLLLTFWLSFVDGLLLNIRRRIALSHTSEYRDNRHCREILTITHGTTAQLWEDIQSIHNIVQHSGGEKSFTFKLAHNTQERSLTGGRVLYIKELMEQEEFTRKLFGLSNPTITNGGSDMGMIEDTQVFMGTSDGDGGESAAAPKIPERADKEGMEEEPCDDPAAVVEGEHLESSGGEKSVALGAGAPPSPRAHGRHQAHAAGEENEDDLKPLERLYQEQLQSTESYQVTSNLLQQTLTEFKTDVSQKLERNNEILQQQNEVLRQQSEILQHHLQRNNEILQQQNEALCQLLRRSNETLNEMRQILSLIVVPASLASSSPVQKPSAAGHTSDTREFTSWGRHRRY
ncbi:hypothetical protein scyTo_0013984 [Scyliorhinus torazame]|uniref:Uncharacterized protein n=1 Tax=Scyliorhinus torazame TaxID=75743 RepID=A0A401P8U3_SCYTO|nr:hypothetical protein [Scyliorhinus torazame]